MINKQTQRLTTKRGFILDAFQGDTITREIESSGEYDSNTLNSLVDILGRIKPEIALDVGANIGNHSLLIAQYTKRLIAFEPVSFIYSVLKNNLSQNNVIHAEAYNLGLSNQKTSRTIHILNNGNLGSSSIEVNDDVAETQEINTVIADEFLREINASQQIDFIKMDVEGHEVSVILGMKNLILNNQPLMLLEWKNQQMIDGFIGHQLFETVFNDYSCYALSYTTNKKVHSKNMLGYFRRIYQKIIGKDWCFANFNKEQKYANVYLIPKRYGYLTQEFKYIAI
jgi:FkbM family methyltransferase